MDKAAKITSVSCYCSCVRKMFVIFTDNGRKIHTVGRSIPSLISKLAVDTVEFIYQCFSLFWNLWRSSTQQSINDFVRAGGNA